jgi:serine/threonine protein kinase
VTEDFASSSPGGPAGIGPGSRLAGYLIEEQVGAGGMAVVYRGRDEVLGRLVAVKVLSAKLAADQDFRARFLRESRAIAAVDEPHVLPVYAAGDVGGVLYIATRFVAGGDLATVLRDSGGPLAPPRVASLVEQVAAALDAAHAIGLVHRDVKPANVLIETIQGRSEYAYLSDFGLTKASSDATGLTATGMFMGTPDYCAPEQILGNHVDGRADQYALACVAFNLLTGSIPYQRGDTLATLFAHVKDPVPAATAIRADLPYSIDAVLAKAMGKEPAGRYGSCGEFAAALRGALVPSAQPPAYTPTQVAPPPISPAVGTPAPAWAAAGRPQRPRRPPRQRRRPCPRQRPRPGGSRCRLSRARFPREHRRARLRQRPRPGGSRCRLSKARFPRPPPGTRRPGTRRPDTRPAARHRATSCRRGRFRVPRRPTGTRDISRATQAPQGPAG